MNTMSTEQDFTITGHNRQLETEASFNADRPLTLSATNASGRIELRTDPTRPSGSVLVVVRRTDNDEFDDDDHALTVKVDDNVISIHPDWQFAAGFTGLARRFRDQLQHGFRPEDWNLSRLKLSPELDFHIFITLPAGLAEGSQIKLRTASGEIDARDIAARVSIVTASGDVEAADLTGVIAINTASGDVQANDITDSLEINTASGNASIRGGDIWLAARSASGDVSVQDTRLRNSRVTSVSGDISLRAIFDNTANYGMETVSGDVSLDTRLPGQNVMATLGFGTLSGSSNVGSAWEKRKRREWSAGSGDQGASINVKTVSGDLSAAARLDNAIEARTLAMPRSAKDQEDDADSDFSGDMREFKREMKEFGREMKHMGHVTPPAPPPTPPTPPTPPSHWDEDSTSDYEQAMRDYEEEIEQQARDYEQAMLGHEQEIEQRARELEQRQGDRQQDREQRLRDREQRRRDHEQRHLERQRDRDQRRRDHEQRRLERQEDRERRRSGGSPANTQRPGDHQHSPIFTAGPSGRPYRDAQAPPAQPTEPVAPPQPFEEEEVSINEPAPTNESQHTEPVASVTDGAGQTDLAEPASEGRLTILERLERGEIDIDEAMARLEAEKDR